MFNTTTQSLMNKTIWISSLLLLMITLPSLKALAETNDSVVEVRYTVTRNWLKMYEGVDYISDQEKERYRYNFGNRRTTRTSNGLLYLNDTMSFYMDDPTPAAAGGFSTIREPFLIQRNFASMQIHDILSFQRNTLIIQDTLIMPTWKILNEIREIAGHICMSASYTDTIRGQHVTAWFSLSYPSLAGPERHCGLPGLILGIDINNGALEIMATSIDTVPLTDQLTMPSRFDGRRIRGQEVTETEYRSSMQEHFATQRRTGQYPFIGVRY